MHRRVAGGCTNANEVTAGEGTVESSPDHGVGRHERVAVGIRPPVDRLADACEPAALYDQGVISPEVFAPLDDCLAIANRVVHGEYVTNEVAEDIARIGVRVLEALRTPDEGDHGAETQ